MSFGGLIAGALKGAATGYTEMAKQNMDKQNKIDLEKEISEIAIQRDQRIKEADTLRARGEEKYRNSQEYVDMTSAGDRLRQKGAYRNITELAPDAQAAATATGKANAGARAAVASDNANADRAEFDAGKSLVKDKAVAAGQNEAAGEVAKVGTSGYIAAARAEAGAKESSASRAAAAESGFKLQLEKDIATLRGQLAKLPDGDPRRAALEQQIRDLTPGSNRSFSDVVAMGNGLRAMADSIRKELADPMASANMSKEDKAARAATARMYEDRAAAVFQSVEAKRLPGGAYRRDPADRRPLGAILDGTPSTGATASW